MPAAHDLAQGVGNVRQVKHVAALSKGNIVKLSRGVGRRQLAGRFGCVAHKAVILGDARFAVLDDQHIVLRGVRGKFKGNEHAGAAQVF